MSKINPLLRLVLWWFGPVFEDMSNHSIDYRWFRFWLWVARMKTIHATGDVDLAKRWYPNNVPRRQILYHRQRPGRTWGNDVIRLFGVMRYLLANRTGITRILIPLLAWILLSGTLCRLFLGPASPLLFSLSLGVAVGFPLAISLLLCFVLWLKKVLRALFSPLSANVGCEARTHKR